MSKRCISIIKLIKKLFLQELQLISYSSHSHQKTSFFKVAKVVAHDILLTVETFILTLAVNRQVYHKPLCAFSHNSLHYHQSYRETKSEDDEILKKSAGALRVILGSTVHLVNT